MQIIAKTFQGLEEVLAQEVRTLGAKHIEIGRRAVSFQGNQELLYRANLECRTAIRILKNIHSFTARDKDALYASVQKFDWTKLITAKDTIAVDAVVKSDFFRHSKYAALKVKDAIVDQIRDRTGRRPNVDVKNPTYRIHLFVNDQFGDISLDSSGQSLHRRGYRDGGGRAPISEVLAAGMVMLSGWNGKIPLVDLTCGSGTICIEAANIALGISPFSKDRKFGLENWKDFDDVLWKMIRQDAFSKKSECPEIIGIDNFPRAIENAETNKRNAGLQSEIKFITQDFNDYTPTASQGIIISNPPYDERLQINDIEAFYKSIGDVFKQKFSGWQAWLISSNIPALKRVGLKASRRIPLFNGPLECRLYKFEMYSGSRKVKKDEIES